LLYFATRSVVNAKQTGFELDAFNEHDGTQSWMHDFGDLQTPATTPPGVASGKVYLTAGADESTTMFAFDAKTGTKVFSTPASSQGPIYRAPVVTGGTVYSEDGPYGGMSAFNADTGARQWFAKLFRMEEWAPAVDADYCYVYLLPFLKVVDRRTGGLVGELRGSSGGPDGGTPMIGAPHNVIVATYYGLDNFDTAKGELRWTVPGHFLEGPAYDNKQIFAMRTDPFTIEVRSETDGAMLWSWTPPAPSRSWRGNVLLTRNLVFVSTDKATYAIDRTSHATVWTLPFTGKLAMSAYGVLYINSDTSIVAVNVK
jgi:outer membrane protein assembly factor BamB